MELRLCDINSPTVTCNNVNMDPEGLTAKGFCPTMTSHHAAQTLVVTCEVKLEGRA